MNNVAYVSAQVTYPCLTYPDYLARPWGVSQTLYHEKHKSHGCSWYKP